MTHNFFPIRKNVYFLGSNIDESDTAAKPLISVEETRLETRVEILRTPASPKKVKTTRKKWKKTISSTTLGEDIKSINRDVS